MCSECDLTTSGNARYYTSWEKVNEGTSRQKGTIKRAIKSSTLKNRRNFCKFSNFILGICKRKYEGGCSNYQTDGLLLQENTRTKGTFLAGNEDYFSVGECYDKCINYPGCHGFFVSKDNSRCALFKEGCQQRIDNYPYWDYYELSDDCEGIFAIF